MADFAQANTATVKMKVNLNADGFIAQSGEEVAGAKYFSVSGLSAASSLADAKAFYDATYAAIGGGTFDTLTAQKTITSGVSE